MLLCVRGVCTRQSREPAPCFHVCCAPVSPNLRREDLYKRGEEVALRQGFLFGPHTCSVQCVVPIMSYHFLLGTILVRLAN